MEADSQQVEMNAEKCYLYKQVHLKKGETFRFTYFLWEISFVCEGIVHAVKWFSGFMQLWILWKII